ncbi:MAG: hypothetical protein E7449_06460 [Ruminococcaceae bacterium]|nr:hypothetical protein [Oscillospiraceae bacterium]
MKRQKDSSLRLLLISTAILAAALVLSLLLWPKILAFWQRPHPWSELNAKDYDLAVLQCGTPTGSSYLITGDAIAEVIDALNQNIGTSELGHTEKEPYYILRLYRSGKYRGCLQFPVGGSWASAEKLVRTPPQGIYWHCDGNVTHALWTLFCDAPSTSFPFPETEQILQASCRDATETYPITAEDCVLLCQALQDALLLAKPASGTALNQTDEYRYLFTFRLDDHLTLELYYFDLPEGKFLRGSFRSGAETVARITAQKLLSEHDPFEDLTFLPR